MVENTETKEVVMRKYDMGESYSTKEDKPNWEVVGWKYPDDDRFHVWSARVITSVKRISDGEIFSIGDETNIGKITKFEIGDTCFWWNEHTWYYLSQAKKKSKPKEQQPQIIQPVDIINKLHEEKSGYQKLYTQQQVDELCENVRKETWDAARSKWCKGTSFETYTFTYLDNYIDSLGQKIKP